MKNEIQIKDYEKWRTGSRISNTITEMLSSEIMNKKNEGGIEQLEKTLYFLDRQTQS